MADLPEGNKGRLDSPTEHRNTSEPRVRTETVDAPRVEEGYAYVARLVGDEKRDGYSVSISTVNVFTCLRCAALVADQEAHNRWHDAGLANDHYVTQQDLQGE